ncbi:MAG: phosphatidate cytidylyltransferase [Proteobacteria bacterium]|nr:phosphatidate cytidylyltransferase [Pseudomonadota bacterium]
MSESDPAQTSGPEASEAPVHPRPSTPWPEEKPKRASDLTLRLLTAGFLIPFVLYIIVIGGLPYLAVVMGFTVLGLREFYLMIEEKGARPLVSIGLAVGAALPVVAYVGNEYHATLLMTASLLVFMIAQLRKAQISEALASISGTFFGVFYVGWLLSHIIVLRNFYDVAVKSYGAEAVASVGLVPEAGIFLTILTLSVAVMCDAGAYFAGKAYGRRSLAPKISPNKSVEGAVGGILAAVAGGAAFKAVFDLFLPTWSAFLGWELLVPFALVIAITGIIGDLVESMLKRDADVKDAGALLPGMGGVLDRIDSPLLVVPIMYYMLLGTLYLQLG